MRPSVYAVHEQPTHAHVAHLAERDFGRAVGHPE